MNDALRAQLSKALGSAYTLERELGGGGMSHVFVATETALGREVVVKILPEDMAGQISVERFKREIAVAARLQHPHIVPLLTAGDADGLPYFTMPFVRGESLRARLVKGGELPVNEAIRVLREVAAALAFAHDGGVVHRDIKPDNVLMSGGSAMVTDFGVAKALSASTTAGDNAITSLGVALGTPAYMSPEQASADPLVDHRADIYAWGILAYELLTGGTPFSGRPAAAMLSAQITEPVEQITRRRTTIPPALAALVMKCLEKRAADRPQSAHEIVHALDALSTPSGGMTPAPGAVEPIRAGASKKWVAVAAAVLAISGLTWFALHRGGGAALPRTIAVMPFENSSHDTTVDYLADGIGDEIHSQLTKVAGLTVRGQVSANTFKGRAIDFHEAGNKLNVAVIVVGKMSASGGRLRVTVDLLRTDDGGTLWSETYERDVKDVPAVRDSIVRSIANSLKLTGAGSAPPRRVENAAARDLMMRGRFAAQKSSEADLRQAVRFYELALQQDSTLAEAWAGIAWAEGYLADAYVSPAVAYPLAQTAARKALALDDNLAEAHVALGTAQLFYDWNVDTGMRELDRALALDPQDANGHVMRALMLLTLGRPEEAMTETDRAGALNPLDPFIRDLRSWAMLSEHKPREAIAEYTRMHQLDSTFYYELSIDALAYLDLGKPDSALIAAQRGEKLAGGAPSVTLALVYARLGRREDAQRVISAMEALYRTHYVQPEMIGAAYASLGEMDRAFEWFDKDFEIRSAFWMFYPRFSIWDPIKKDPRWAKFVARAEAAKR